MSDYQGATVTADRQPENRIVVQLDREGFVCGQVAIDKTATDPTRFLSVMRKTRKLYPIDHSEVVLPDPSWTLGADGRAHKDVRDPATDAVVARISTEDVIFTTS